MNIRKQLKTRAGRILEQLDKRSWRKRIQESPANITIFDDTDIKDKKKSKIKVDDISRKTGKFYFRLSTFNDALKQLKYYQDKLLNLDDWDIKNKAILHFSMSGTVYHLDKTIFKELKSSEYIYLADGDWIRGFVYLTDYKKLLSKSGKYLGTCKKQLMWKDKQHPMSPYLDEFILDYYFEELGKDLFLCDDYYTKEGKNSLLRLLTKSLDRSLRVYYVYNDIVQKEYQSKEEIISEFESKFGNTREFIKHKFLISSDGI